VCASRLLDPQHRRHLATSLSSVHPSGDSTLPTYTDCRYNVFDVSDQAFLLTVSDGSDSDADAATTARVHADITSHT
jgi:hypothetical protein